MADYLEPEADGGSPLRIVAAGVDSLFLGFCGRLDGQVTRRLELAKSAARGVDLDSGEVVADGPKETPFRLGNNVFMISPNGAGAYRYVITNADVRVKLDTAAPAAPSTYARLSSECLWTNGLAAAIQSVQDLALGLMEDSRADEVLVSRADLAVDFQGYVPVAEELYAFTTRARKRACYHDGRAFTGFSFGKGSILCRMYDKTREIESSKKDWMKAVWRQSPEFNADVPVWRVEFQFRREALKKNGAGLLEPFTQRINSLWSYGSKQWIVLRVPDSSERPERWKVRPAWTRLSGVKFTETSTPLIRYQAGEADMKRLLSALHGVLTGAGAVLDVTALDDLLDRVRPAYESYLHRKGVTFEEEVERKRCRHATIQAS